MSRTIVELVHNIHAAAINLDMDITPEDTAFIISSFLQAFIDEPLAEGPVPVVDEMLQKIIDEVSKVKNDLDE